MSFVSLEQPWLSLYMYLLQSFFSDITVHLCEPVWFEWEWTTRYYTWSHMEFPWTFYLSDARSSGAKISIRAAYDGTWTGIWIMHDLLLELWCQLWHWLCSAQARVWIGQGDNVQKGHFMPYDKMGMVWFHAYMGWYGGGWGKGDERFGGEAESLWCVFEWKYMI